MRMVNRALRSLLALLLCGGCAIGRVKPGEIAGIANFNSHLRSCELSADCEDSSACLVSKRCEHCLDISGGTLSATGGTTISNVMAGLLGFAAHYLIGR